ncbi:MAG: energy transducer TonB [Pseudomonadales bacterium]
MSALSIPTFNNRLAYTLFLALAAHALILLAVGFEMASKPSIAPSLEVTLAQRPDETDNPDADFLAQANQAGSGESTEIKKLANDSHISDDTTQRERQRTPSEAADMRADQSAQQGTSSETQTLLEQHYATLELVISERSQHSISAQSASASESGSQVYLPSEQLDMAALLAQIELRRENMAKAPKRRIISSLSTKSDSDAEYLDSWRRRIVDVGNIHYPKAADEQRLYGSVRMAVSITSDGKLQSIEILKPSGSLILDNAAVRIVKLAAPFPPFSQEMRESTDILEIIRTWKFEKTTQIY